MSEVAIPEVALRRDRRALLALLAALSVGCWSWSLWMAAQMASAHPHHGAGPAGLALFAMWSAMMVGMMIPSEAPFLLRLARESPGRRPLLQAMAFLAGYLAPWIAFSLGAAVLQARLQSAGLMDPGMATSSAALGGWLLIAAGAAQLSPLKRACLERCGALPVAPRGVAAGTFLGMRNSAISLGSCGLLMLVLFVTGVMSVHWMAALTALLLLERMVPRRWGPSLISGTLLLGWGFWKLLA